MQTIEGLRRRIKSADDLLSVVKTMKALAAVSIRHYEQAVAALAEYNSTVERGLQIVLQAEDGFQLAQRAPVHGRLGAIIFGTDQGLCGQFNERIVQFAVEQMATLESEGECRILAVGDRARVLLEEAGHPAQVVLTVPGGIAGVTPLVQDLLLTIDRWREVDNVDQVVLFHQQPSGGALYDQRLVRLLPLDLEWLGTLEEAPWASTSLPIFKMDRDLLFAQLIRQTLFVALYRACAESLASEDASRLAAMQNAERNIKDRLAELHAAYHHQRQDTITTELLDIVAGYEAVIG